MGLIALLLLAAVFGPQAYREVKRRRLKRDIEAAGAGWPEVAGADVERGDGEASLYFVGGSVGEQGFGTSAPYVMVAFDDTVFVARQIAPVGRDSRVTIASESRPRFSLEHRRGRQAVLRAIFRPVEVRSSADRVASDLSRRGWIVDGRPA
jgi:hypothetical protein